MKVVRDRYMLSELARYLIEEKLGGEDTLLMALREGKLQAHVRYDHVTIDIPPGYWEVTAHPPGWRGKCSAEWLMAVQRLDGWRAA